MPMSLSSKKRHALLALIAILSLAAVASAQENSTPTVKIKNFGQMDDRFYRGAQPKEKEFKDLATLGIRTDHRSARGSGALRETDGGITGNDLRQHSHDRQEVSDA